jgi:galactokinase
MNIQNIFRQLYESEPLVVRAPGRINLIGEHLDYNGGLVLPAAISFYTTVAVGHRPDNRISLFSMQLGEQVEFSFADIRPRRGEWFNYVLGVVNQLQQRGQEMSGFNMVIDGNVPIGAGLSSSASLASAALLALQENFGWDIPRLELALMAQAAEHQYAGVTCGIMDIYASFFGLEDHALLLNCRLLEHTPTPLSLGAYRIVCYNTNVKHNLSGSAYNQRREECAQGLEWIQEYYPEVPQLAAASIEQVTQCIQPRDFYVYQRCRYVVEEQARVHAACTALKENDLEMTGQLLYHTHRGLRRLYEVSCLELDFLVEGVRHQPGVLGARMMGGGFGGCTINLIHQNQIEAVTSQLSAMYLRKLGKRLDAHIATIAGGASIIQPQLH